MTDNDALAHLLRLLARARSRAADLRAELEEFDRTAFGGQQSAVFEDGGLSVSVVLTKALDPEWEITVTEIAATTRAALDQAVTFMVVAAGGDVDRHRGSFPIETTREGYETRSSSALRGVPELARQVVVGVQPFTSEDPDRHPLGILAHTSNWTKHRDGQPGLVVMRNSQMAIVSPKHQTVQVYNFGSPGPFGSLPLPLVDDEGIPRVLLPESVIGDVLDEFNLTLGDDPEATLDVLVHSGVAFGKRQIFVAHLQQVIEFVELNVVSALAPYITHR